MKEMEMGKLDGRSESEEGGVGAGGISVAYLGPEATYTHQAALKYFTPSPPTTTTTSTSTSQPPTLIPHPTIPSLFHTLQSPITPTTHAICPLENSTNGSVVSTLDLLADTQHQFPSILIIGETYIRVEHALLGFKSTSSSPETNPQPKDLSRITTLYSHPQAWTQCTTFLSQNFPAPNTAYKDVSSTSFAAKLVAQDRSGRSAALASRLAAEVYGLDVLREGCQDVKSGEGGNWTRFLVLGRVGDGDEDRDPGMWKGLLTLSPTSDIDSPIPVDLNTALSHFSRHDLSIVKIESRPSGRRAWEYVYIVEFRIQGSDTGKKGVDQVVEKMVDDMEKGLGGKGACVRVWGVWRDGWERR